MQSAGPPAPRLSIILATYNASASLEACLQSVNEQTFRDFELIIVDGGSTDATVGIIERHTDKIAYWHSQPDKGIYDAWNQAVVRARGEYVCFIGADDAWLGPNALASLFGGIGEEPYDLVSSRALMSFPTGRTEVVGSGWDFARFGRRMGICHPGLLHRRALFEDYGCFDDSYRIAGDLEFLLRLPACTRALHVAEVIVTIGGGGISRSQIMLRLREQRRALAACPRFGSTYANLVWLDKMWRYPIARLFKLSY